MLNCNKLTFSMNGCEMGVRILLFHSVSLTGLHANISYFAISLTSCAKIIKVDHANINFNVDHPLIEKDKEG